MTPNIHTHREAWLHEVANGLRPVFARHGYPLPPVRLACGLPSVRALSAKNRRIGECWPASASDDGTVEIMVSPVLADPMRVAGVLAHELVHAAVGSECGHKGPFRTLAKQIGLEGKMTATTEGAMFKHMIAPLLDAAGPYPHAALSAQSRKKQGTRLLKAVCPDCGYTVRITRKWVDDVGAPHCPLDGEMAVEE